MGVIDEYAKEVPEEIKRAISAIDNEKRLGILVALLKNGEMTFSQLKEITELNQSTLTAHLKILQKGALVKNFYKKRFGKTEYSYYDTTDFGEDFLDGLYRSIEIEPQIEIVSRGLFGVTENRSVVLESAGEEALVCTLIPPPGIETETSGRL